MVPCAPGPSCPIQSEGPILSEPLPVYSLPHFAHKLVCCLVVWHARTTQHINNQHQQTQCWSGGCSYRMQSTLTWDFDIWHSQSSTLPCKASQLSHSQKGAILITASLILLLNLSYSELNLSNTPFINNPFTFFVLAFKRFLLCYIVGLDLWHLVMNGTHKKQRILLMRTELLTDGNNPDFTLSTAKDKWINK